MREMCRYSIVKDILRKFVAGVKLRLMFAGLGSLDPASMMAGRQVGTPDDTVAGGTDDC